MNHSLLLLRVVSRLRKICWLPPVKYKKINDRKVIVPYIQAKLYQAFVGCLENWKLEKYDNSLPFEI